MYTGLLHTHSFLRYVALILLVATVIKTFIGWQQKKEFGNLDDKLSLFSFISLHTQLLIGLILYFVSPIVQVAMGDAGAAMKNPELRYFLVEHISVMIIGIVLVSVGRIKAKKLTDDVAKHKTTFIFFAIGLLLILSRIPWPFTSVARAW